MPKLQRDAPAQAPERSEPTSATTASGKRSVAAGRDITAPVFLGDIRDSVIKIYTSLSLLPRVVLLAILLIAALTLGGVALLVLETHTPVVSPATPDPDQFETVGSPDLNLAITALAVPDGADQAELWIGAQSGTQHALYRLDTTQQADATPQHVLDVDEQIIDLTVDCKGNVWLLLNELGTLVYQPQTGQHSTLLNRATTNGWLVKYTTFAIATRCTDDAVEVWLGRKGVHTLRYNGDYPSTDTLAFVPWEDDDVFKASQELADVRALHYAADSETLWAADRYGQLLSLSLKGVLTPQVINGEDAFWSLSQSPDGVVWAGGSQHLRRTGDKNQAIALVQGDGTGLNSRAFVIAAGQRWVWFGDRCTGSSADCWPLGVYSQGSLFRIALGARKEVRDIVIDPTGAVWIGTETGLIFYPAP